MKPILRCAIFLFALLFLGGAVFAWFDILTHDNILTNPELKLASGWLLTGLMFLGFGLRSLQKRPRLPASNSQTRRPHSVD
jgi:hypothetical protein